jgi:glycosyltransferase involved in cell wall biosynthesis
MPSRRPPSGLRIAQIAPVETPVTPAIGESVEVLLSLLIDELVRRGHAVTLFATGDSVTTGELRSLFDEGYRWADDDELWDWQFAESMHVSAAYAQADEFDVMHCHSYHFGLPLAPFVRVPNVHTHHVEMSPSIVDAYRRHGDVHLVLMSRFQARSFDGRPNIELIPHGIDTAGFPRGDGAGGYLLFLGRMIADKGPAEAVRIARAADMPLVLAGPEDDDFASEVAPLVDGRQVTYVGRVGTEDRNRLLAGAGALLYPLRYPEPFGLVMVEAMACGTPVVATRVGAVPEIVERGITGYTARSWEELPALVPAALELDRARVRQRAIARFDIDRMVDRHEALYIRLAERARRGAAA